MINKLFLVYEDYIKSALTITILNISRFLIYYELNNKPEVENVRDAYNEAIAQAIYSCQYVQALLKLKTFNNEVFSNKLHSFEATTKDKFNSTIGSLATALLLEDLAELDDSDMRLVDLSIHLEVVISELKSLSFDQGQENIEVICNKINQLKRLNT